MLADKPTELSRIKLKTWTRQLVPMISEHSAHLAPLSVDFRTCTYIYIYIYIYQMDCVCQRYHKECPTHAHARMIAKTDLIHEQLMRPLRHGGCLHDVKDASLVHGSSQFRHLYIYIYIYIYIHSKISIIVRTWIPCQESSSLLLK